MEIKERWLWPYELNLLCVFITYFMTGTGLAVESAPSDWGPLGTLRQFAPIYWASPMLTIAIDFLMITVGIVAVELYAKRCPRAKFVVYVPTVLCLVDFLWDIAQIFVVLQSLTAFI